jgi:dTDP-4-dehydrorhamnose reductase
MKKKKLLIIGKNSFLGKNLYIALKNKINTHILSFKDFRKLTKKKINNYSHICNCSINPDYVKFKYDKKNDTDLEILKKIKNTHIHYIFLSTRKIYKNKKNIKEMDRKMPKCNYSKNKLITENKITKFLPNKFTTHLLQSYRIVGTQS